MKGDTCRKSPMRDAKEQRRGSLIIDSGGGSGRPEQEGSMEITGRSPPAPTSACRGARWRGRPLPPASALDGGPLFRDAAEEEAFVREEEEDAERLAAQKRKHPFYHKVILLHGLLASEEDRVWMAEPTCWRPVLPTDMSMEMQVKILQGLVDVRNRWPSAPNPCALCWTVQREVKGRE